MSSRLRCFYHSDFFLPLPDGHPFPMEKIPQASKLLMTERTEVEILPVAPASMRQLLRVHTSGASHAANPWSFSTAVATTANQA